VLKTGHHLSDAEIRARYDALPHRGGLGPEFLDRVLRLAGDLDGLTVLDLGCGRGELLAEIARRHPRARLFGLDVSAVRAHAALRATGARAALVGASAEAPPFRAGAFDRVFCTETLEHLKAPERCVGEIARLLAPGGRAILTVPNATGFAPFHRLGRLVPGRWLRSKLLPYEHPANTDQPIDTCFTYGEILALVRRGGLAIEAVAGWRYVRWLQMLPVARTAYGWCAPTLERLAPRLGGVRFAYNLLLRCRRAADGAARPPRP